MAEMNMGEVVVLCVNTVSVVCHQDKTDQSNSKQRYVSENECLSTSDRILAHFLGTGH